MEALTAQLEEMMSIAVGATATAAPANTPYDWEAAVNLLEATRKERVAEGVAQTELEMWRSLREGVRQLLALKGADSCMDLDGDAPGTTPLLSEFMDSHLDTLLFSPRFLPRRRALELLGICLRGRPPPMPEHGP